jgi:ATP-binding cassette subfamily F protein 3
MQAEMAELETRLGQSESNSSALQRYGALLETFQAREGYAMQARVEATLYGLGFGAEDLQKPAAQLSGGQKNMAALARVLLEAPDLLLLDEPSNHLDIVATEWLEGFIRDYQGAVVVISHDRYFLDRTVEEIVEIERHRLTPYPGNYSAYVKVKAERLEQQRKAYEQQQADIRRQEEFIRRNMAGQKTKQAQSRQKALDRLDRVAPPTTDGRRIGLQFETNQRESHEVIVCRKVHKSYGPHHVLRGVDFTVYRGEKVGLMGPNGAGKSTLLRLLMQQDTADEGTLRLGRNTAATYYDQEMAELNPNATALDEVWQIAPLKSVGEMRSYLARFLFSGDEVYNVIGHLSGGEKSRVALAKLMLSPANLLILDEPTNHLDIPAREALESALSEYPGAALIVSHDRYFLDRIVSRLLYLRDGRCDAYPGNYTDYQAHLAARQVEAQRAPAAKAAVKVKGHDKSDRAKFKTPRAPRRRKPEVIERDIGDVEAAIEALQDTLDTEQQSADWQRLAELTSQQGALATRLEALMHEWEESMMAAEEGRR